MGFHPKFYAASRFLASSGCFLLSVLSFARAAPSAVSSKHSASLSCFSSCENACATFSSDQRGSGFCSLELAADSSTRHSFPRTGGWRGAAEHRADGADCIAGAGKRVRGAGQKFSCVAREHSTPTFGRRRRWEIHKLTPSPRRRANSSGAPHSQSEDGRQLRTWRW